MTPSSFRRATLLVACAAVPVAAQARRDTLTLPPEVVTATRLPGVPRTPTATATVLDGDVLRAEGITHLADALRRVPGLSVVRSSSFGSPVSLFLRGGESDYVRVLVDGVPVNDPGGAVDLGRITLDDVERIEVVRGPSSVLYGSEAVTGVIQLFTRRGGAPQQRAEVGGGSYGTRRASLGADGRLGGATWTLQGDHHASDGILAYNNAYRNDGLAGALSFRRGASDLRVTTRYSGSSYRYPTGSGGALEDRNAERGEHRLLLGAEGGRRWNDRFEVRAAFTANTFHPRTSDGADDAGDTLGFYGFTSTAVVTRRVADLRTVLRTGRAAHLTLGVEAAREVEHANSVSLSEFGPSADSSRNARDTRAAYAQFLGEHGRLAWSAGARLDDNSAFGTFRTVRLGAAWRLAPALRARASVGNAFKAPSFYENFATGFVIGNAALRPERSRATELGVEGLLAGRALVRVTGFTQRFRDLIQYTFVTPAPGDPNYYNVAEANAGGVEVEAELPDLAGVDAIIGYTWTDTRVVDAGFDTDDNATFVAGNRLLRRPEHVASLRLARTLGRAGRVSAVVMRVGEREDRDYGVFPAGVVRLPAYATIDLAAELALPGRWWPGAQLQLRADNVADARLEQIAGFRAPGRTLYAGLKLSR
ncbi:MAG: TonB-dependent receptor [Gemmatimonadaceae bacterium]|nr:TonB-dependent receptor [Gemmatimonadaceae bacterium]